MMALWLPELPRPAVHLAYYRGDVGRWGALCHRVTASYSQDADMQTEADWKGRGGGRPVELLNLAHVPAGLRVCGTCLRTHRAEVRDLHQLLERTGQADG